MPSLDPLLSPAWILILGALGVPLLRGALRSAYVLALPIASGLCLLSLPLGSSPPLELFDYALVIVQLDALSRLFATLFVIAAFIGSLFSLRVRDALQPTCALLYAGSALGAVLAGDWLTLFAFWEGLAISSVFLIWARDTPRARRAGLRYLIVQVCSGLLLFAGIAIRSADTGSLALSALSPADPGALWILAALGIKCAFPAVHGWLTDAYPEATPGGTVILSAFTTKVAVYALARVFPGTEALIYVGAAMTAFPIFYAVIENDLRRVLAYSLINQLGFMVCGIGLGSELAINGAVAHAFNDVIFKGLLFMSMGAVLQQTGKIGGSELGGLYKSMPITAALCLVGAASISAFPLFSGFVSKSMVMSAALEQGHDGVWLVLLFASAGVFHHAGIKIPYFAFFAHDAGIRCAEAPRPMLCAMALAAGLCLFNGMFPGLFLYPMLPYPVSYVPYTASHVISQLQLLSFSALAFAWLNLRGLYPPELPSTNLDADYLYRRAAPRAARALSTAITRARAAFSAQLRRAVQRSVHEIARHSGPSGALGEPWLIGTSALWAALLLGITLVLFYL